MNTEDAIRRGQPGSYQRVQLPICSSVALPTPSSAECTFHAALDSRVSGERFGQPTNEELSNFLGNVCGIRYIDRDDRNRQKRCVASIGALHPAHLLLYLRSMGWCVYEPTGHSLGLLPVREESSKQLLQLVDEHVPAHEGVVICLLSDYDLANNYYENCMPLLFRDAGRLMGHAALVAPAYGLSFRILGRTGTATTESLVVGIRFTAIATGLALLGSKRTSELQGSV